MSARILIATDLHKRPTDLTTIGGYVKAVESVQRDLLKYIRENNITHFISTGDWYDKGYHDTNRLVNDLNFDREIRDAVNGNAYICVGNHMFLERDSNPELYIIQPNERFRPKDKVHAVEPIFKAVDTLQIGPLQISLFHYDKDNKNYIAQRNPETTYHVGVYHDATIVPSSIRQMAGYMSPVKSTAIAQTLSNIDLAVVGHIHNKIGLQSVNLGTREVPMLIPGALCVCRNSGAEKHHSVQLPVIEVGDDNSIKVSFAEFSTHMDELTFYNKRDPVIPKVQPTFAGGERNEQVFTDITQASLSITDMRGFLTARGYSPLAIQTLEDIATGKLTEYAAVVKMKEVF